VIGCQITSSYILARNEIELTAAQLNIDPRRDLIAFMAKYSQMRLVGLPFADLFARMEISSQKIARITTALEALK